MPADKKKYHPTDPKRSRTLGDRNINNRRNESASKEPFDARTEIWTEPENDVSSAPKIKSDLT